MSGVPWQRYESGSTPLDFGKRYIFADAEGRRMSLRWSMGLLDAGPPKEAAWCLPWEWLASTIPSPPIADDQRSEAA